MKPVYKIETWTGAVKDYTITDEADFVYFKEALTDQIGQFYFTIPTVKGIPNPYYYMDIAVNDKVKIWVGYDDYTDNPQFVGRVERIEGPASVPNGFARRVSGYSLGAILLRQFKQDKIYNGVAASTIVTEWANDLGLGLITDDPPDTTPVNMEIYTKTYFDALRDISDYYYDGDTQIKKDFYVDIGDVGHPNGHLVWKSRPFRINGVDTLTLGKNVQTYQVTRSAEPVKNRIWVYGATWRSMPADKDLWTLDSVDNWEAVVGTLSEETGTKKTGTNALKATSAAGGYIIHFRRWFPSELFMVGKSGYRTLFFWIYLGANPDYQKVRLLAPDTSNYFEAACGFVDPLWNGPKEWSLGLGQEYDAVFNPNGPWTKVGNPNWGRIAGIEFYIRHSTADRAIILDALHFGYGHYRGFVESAPSKTSYETRDLEVIDEKLMSDTECVKRAETLLYQLKDAPTQWEVTVKPGSNNLLVGDRIWTDFPPEIPSATKFYVLSVEQTMSKQSGFTTKATMVDTENVRARIPLQPQDKLFQLNRMVRELSLDEKRIG